MTSITKQPHSRERLYLAIIVGLIALSPFTMEVYLPAMQLISQELGTSIVQVNYTITFYLLGAAIGETIGGSISDQIGRKQNVVIGLCTYIIASMGIAISNDITTIQFLRFFQAFGGGFAVIVGLPTLRDIFDPETNAKKMPLVIAATMMAPMIAPVFGTILMQWDWRSIFVFLSVYGLFIAVLFVKFVPAGKGNGQNFSFSALLNQYKKVLVFRAHGKYVALYYVLLQGFLAGVFLTFLTNASWIYLSHYGVALTLLPLLFLIHTGTTFLSNILISKLMIIIDARKIMHIGSIVHICSVSAMFVLQLNDRLTLIAFTLLLFPMMCGANMLMTTHRAILLAYFEKLTGSATSLLSLSRYSFGALGGLLSGIFFNNTMLPIIVIMFLSSLCAFCLVNVFIPKSTLKEIVLIDRLPEY
jgi:DHA1 family bicyclomycin/chloramphenicol resistance-like MFS transporter